jgi:hypothetical protein
MIILFRRRRSLWRRVPVPRLRRARGIIARLAAALLLRRRRGRVVRRAGGHRRLRPIRRCRRRVEPLHGARDAGAAERAAGERRWSGHGDPGRDVLPRGVRVSVRAGVGHAVARVIERGVAARRRARHAQPKIIRLVRIWRMAVWARGSGGVELHGVDRARHAGSPSIRHEVRGHRRGAARSVRCRRSGGLSSALGRGEYTPASLWTTHELNICAMDSYRDSR